MDPNLQIEEAIRFLLLPAPTDIGEGPMEEIKLLLEKNEDEKTAYGERIRLEHAKWKESGNPSLFLRYLAAVVLYDGKSEISYEIANAYFEIHSSLTGNPFITFELATIILSHLQLIIHLAVKEKMAAGKIARVLKSIDHRVSNISWKEVQVILSKLKVGPQLNPGEAEALYRLDEALQEEHFADADVADASRQVGEIAKNLLFEGDAEYLLNRLSQPDKVHLPYLQILHYQCLISGFYDHSIVTIYEFSPRGNIANELFSKWDSLLHTSNPILNNAKAVDVLDENWARSRKDKEYEQAKILVELLHGIDGMGFAAAQELASWIRRWLVRYIKLNSTEIEPLRTGLTNPEIIRVLRHIISAPTKTYGILEQRFVDVAAATIHSDSNLWRGRGMGDAVNANNLSRRKLGDCDFQNTLDKIVISYEAHGGRLSSTYFEGHLRTFRRSLERRKEELEGIADIEKWQFIIVFVAYEFEAGLPPQYSLDGVPIEIKYVTFEKLLANASEKPETLSDAFSTHFVSVINERRTPAFVRKTISLLLI